MAISCVAGQNRMYGGLSDLNGAITGRAVVDLLKEKAGHESCNL